MSLNKVMLIGRLAGPIECRATSSSHVANFSVATNTSFKDKAGVKHDRAEFHRIIVWGNLASICAKYLRVGAQVYLEGRLQTRSYQDKNGVTKYSTEVQADKVEFLSGTDKTAEPPAEELPAWVTEG